MASRRGLSSLSAVISGFSRLSMTCSGDLAPSGVQQLATLTSLRHVLSGLAAGPSVQQQGAPLRQYSAAAAAAAVGGVPMPGPGQPGPQEPLEVVRSRIFGTHIGNGLRSGRKVLRQKLLGPTMVGYYPVDISKKDPFLLDLKAESAKLKLDKLKRRGKAPPKKGSGKRAGKKK